MSCTDDFILFKKKKREVLQGVHRDSEDMEKTKKKKKKGNVSGREEKEACIEFLFSFTYTSTFGKHVVQHLL